MTDSVAMLITVADIDPTRPTVAISPVAMLQKLFEGKSQEELAAGLKIAVQAGLHDQVRFYHSVGVDLNTTFNHVEKLLYLGYLQSPEMFKLLFSLGARMTPDEVAAMADPKFTQAYAALVEANPAPASGARPKAS